MAATGTLISLFIAICTSQAPTGDLTCDQDIWTIVGTVANWTFTEKCEYENTETKDGAMVWIGDNMPESLDWADYTVEASMVPSEAGGGANGGLAFNIQSVGSSKASGEYYAISIFPVYAGTTYVWLFSFIRDCANDGFYVYSELRYI